MAAIHCTTECFRGASGGYPWTVIRVEDRKAYLAALDRASIDMKIEPFAEFIAERVRWSMSR